MTQVLVGQGVPGTAVHAAVDAASKEDNTDKDGNSWAATYRDWLLHRA